MRKGAGSMTLGYNLRLLLDEDIQAWRLVDLLEAQGHDVLTVGGSDQAGANHAGILCGYQDAIPAKAMRYEDIATALTNRERSRVCLGGLFLALNAWLYWRVSRHRA